MLVLAGEMIGLIPGSAGGQVDRETKRKGLKKDRARRTGDYVKRVTSYKTDRRGTVTKGPDLKSGPPPPSFEAARVSKTRRPVAANAAQI